MLSSCGAGDMWPAQDGQGEPDWVRLCVVCMSVVYELCNVLDSRGAGDMWPAQDGQEEPDWVRLCVVYELCNMCDVLAVQETCGRRRTGRRSRTGCVCVLCMSLCVVYEFCYVLDSRGAGDMWPAQDGQEEPDWVRLCVVYESV